MKLVILFVVAAFQLCAVRAWPAARRRARTRMPFIVRPLGPATSPSQCNQRIGAWRLPTNLPFLALPVDLQKTTARPPLPTLALAIYDDAEPLRLPRLVHCSSPEQATKMIARRNKNRRNKNRRNKTRLNKRGKNRVPRNVYEAYARDQGIPEHGSLQREEMARHYRSQFMNEYWTSKSRRDNSDANENPIAYEDQVEMGTATDMDEMDYDFVDNSAGGGGGEKMPEEINVHIAPKPKGVTPKGRIITRIVTEIVTEPFMEYTTERKKEEVYTESYKENEKERDREREKTRKHNLASSKLDVALALSKYDQKFAKTAWYKADLQAFGDYVASSLSKLSEKSLLSAEDEIQAVLSKYRMRILKRTVFNDLFR